MDTNCHSRSNHRVEESLRLDLRGIGIGYDVCKGAASTTKNCSQPIGGAGSRWAPWTDPENRNTDTGNHGCRETKMS